jgi:hypothetical protein
MSYIFRLHDEGNNTLTDWGGSTKIGSSVIEKIQDPNGESAKREITSIPSPFARIDLVKTAFKKVADAGIDGDSIHHKMVSDSFDIGQIFFEFEKFRDKFDIVVWDKTDSLKELLESPHPEHQQLGDTYQTYLQQDGAVYNFNEMQQMYFLNFKSGPAEMNIIGATSPATLFFTSANDLSYVSGAINFGNDRPFDEYFAPLYKRDIEYQKYWYALRKSVPDFSRLFPEVEKYLAENLKKLDQQKRDTLNAIVKGDYQKSYNPIGVGESTSHTVSVLASIELRQRVQNTASIANVSGFVIQSPNAIDGFLPLVLPVDTYTHKTVYTQDLWDKNTKVPFYESRAIKDRTLPSDGAKYPYLTISDFLTDSIVRMPYEIDGSNFFDGNINKANGNSYLLPLTTVFFHFFSVKDLMERVMTDNKKMFELENKATGVTAVLRIPIRNGYIEYRRTYFEASVDASETKITNDGVLIDHRIGLGIMPLIRFPETVKKHYRIAMFDKGKNDAVLTCIDNNKTIESKQVVRAKKDLAGRGCSHEAYIVEENFDRIKIEIGNNREISGYIVPKFKTDDEGNVQYTFAVDFGTTNTHVEYCTNTNTSPVAFDIKANERQLHKLHLVYRTDPDIRMGFIQEFIPDTIGDGDVYSFPMRTVFAQHKNIKYEQLPMPLADGHIPFLYEKDFTPKWNDIKTELKWGGVHERLLEMHLETIFILMRNKVILNSGNLAATKVVWFYPASMTEAKVNQFKKIWKAAYEKYFGENTKNIISISESKAPYIHFVETQGAAPEVVTIDVGGGTTDVFIVEGEEDKMLLSFRFASNAIFGDGYNSNPNKNGFVCKYKEQFEKIIKDNNLSELSQALGQIEQQKKSSDIIAFLFSLIGDKVKSNPELNFSQKLSNDDRLRYVFIIFYASILYFIAKSMKAKGLKKPKTLAFSGKGALSLRIVSDEMDMIERFVKLIFDGVYGDTKGSIEVMMEKNPKIATCKGGIKQPVSQDYETIDNIKTILVGNDFDTFSEKKLTYADITKDVQNAVVQSVKDFFTFLFDLHSNNNDFLCNKLAADPAIFNQVKEFILGEKGKQLLSDSMFRGLKNKRQEVTNETKLEETLFFYPLVSILHDLALEITKM